MLEVQALDLGSTLEQGMTTDIIMLSVMTMMGLSLLILSIPKRLRVRLAYAAMIIVYLIVQLILPLKNFDKLHTEMHEIFSDTILTAK